MLHNLTFGMTYTYTRELYSYDVMHYSIYGFLWPFVLNIDIYHTQSKKYSTFSDLYVICQQLLIKMKTRMLSISIMCMDLE